MLKNCWECVMGSRVDNEVYGTVLNGFSSNAWPETLRKNENMFRLPRPLNEGDTIYISGEMLQSPERIFLNLITGRDSPDYNNVVCQLEVDFWAHDRQGEFIIRSIENVQITNENTLSQTPSRIFTGSNYEFLITVTAKSNSSNSELNIFVGDSFLTNRELNYDLEDITFLTIDGDIKKVRELKFTYA